ncbi:(+)-cis,cis-nepetalactol synthase NEPS3-like [Pyrus communis]|uniref:(+)-cis,cis-nepetalactol synthase NEPS3-like n=1 Tax=Pyrus communis TaxID=23211 RepID=UPI0035C05B22
MADHKVDRVSIGQTIKKLQGKVAVVTGGASGIGEATARKFALHGARAVVTVDVQYDKGQNVAASIGHDRSTYIQCDVADEDHSQELRPPRCDVHQRRHLLHVTADLNGL